jgi:hypothetical protein
MKRRVLIGLLMAIGFLSILYVPLIEFIDWGFIDNISMWIHWPIFILGYSEDGKWRVILFIIIWYGVILGLTTAVINYAIQALQIKNRRMNK